MPHRIVSYRAHPTSGIKSQPVDMNTSITSRNHHYTFIVFNILCFFLKNITHSNSCGAECILCILEFRRYILDQHNVGQACSPNRGHNHLDSGQTGRRNLANCRHYPRRSNTRYQPELLRDRCSSQRRCFLVYRYSHRPGIPSYSDRAGDTPDHQRNHNLRRSLLGRDRADMGRSDHSDSYHGNSAHVLLFLCLYLGAGGSFLRIQEG